MNERLKNKTDEEKYILLEPLLCNLRKKRKHLAIDFLIRHKNITLEIAIKEMEKMKK